MAKNPTPDNMDSLPLSPEEIKAIGEIELGPSRHEKFLNAHYKKLIIAIIAIMLIAVAGIIYTTSRAQQVSDSAAALVSALKVTATERAESAAEYDLATLERMAAEYPDTPAGATAELVRGMQLISGGQEQQGVAALEALIAGTRSDALRVHAQAYLAGLYTRAADTAKATELWQAVTRAGQSAYLPLAYLTLGDLAQEAGDTEQARAFYTRLQEECPSSPLVRNVRQRLLLLGVDAPVPEAPAPAPEAPAQDPIPGWNSPLLPTAY